MSTIFMLCSLGAFLLAACYLARLLRPRAAAAFALTIATALSAFIVCSGYLLSALSRLNAPAWWALAGLACLALVVAAALMHPDRREILLRTPSIPRDLEARVMQADRKDFLVRLVLIMTATAAVVAVINFILIVSLEPTTPDVHQYHLARVGYYLQHGHLRSFGASYWAQEIYPKVAAILHLYTYLVSSMACLTQLVQYLAYFISMLAVYGICRLLGQHRRASAFAALTFGLLIICFAEAATAQNDMILTAFLGAALYFLLAFRAWRRVSDLVLAIEAFALSVGVKATFLLTLPSFGLVAAWILFARRQNAPPVAMKHLGVGLLALVIATGAIILPAGYWENARLHGDPFGPRHVRSEFTQEQVPLPAMLANGGLNAIRYAVDSLILDGWHPVPYTVEIQLAINAACKQGLARLGIDLESPRSIRPDFPYKYRKLLSADETLSGWGWLGVLLVWPAVWIVLLGRRRPTDMRVFAAVTVLYYVVLCVLLPYDRFHGRFLIMGALFALPPTAAFVAGLRSRPARIFLAAVVVLCCINALVGATFRNGSPLFPYTFRGVRIPSVFTLTQSQTLIRQSPTRLPLVFDDVVPPGAVVAIDLRCSAPEYLFFGEGFSRRLIPLRPFWNKDGLVRIPQGAEYLVYDRYSPYYRPGGLELTESTYPLGIIYLRSLTGKPLKSDLFLGLPSSSEVPRVTVPSDDK